MTEQHLPGALTHTFSALHIVRDMNSIFITP